MGFAHPFAIYLVITLWIAWWRHAYIGKPQLEARFRRFFWRGKTKAGLYIGASLFLVTLVSEIILGVSGAGARAEMPWPILKC